MAEVETVRGQASLQGDFSKGRSRYEELSVAKMSKANYWTSFGPNLVWGNQEPLWPLNPACLKATPTRRTCSLARPKTSHWEEGKYMPEFVHSCGRSSQIWTVRPGASLASTPSQRTCLLARHKTAPEAHREQRPRHYYSCGRASAIWTTSPGALKCGDRPRTVSLAAAKSLHPEHTPGRPSVQTVVPPAAKTCLATAHIGSLATPKKKPEGPFREPQWEVSRGAMQATASDRTTDLAKCKKPADGYQPGRSEQWRVSTGARSAVPSTRMEELSRPIVRQSMGHLQFNPDVFGVSPAAQKYKASARIEELAKPIERGGGTTSS